MKEFDKLVKNYSNINEFYSIDGLSSEEEVEIMSDNNCREYSENDYVSLKNGGEGRIV